MAGLTFKVCVGHKELALGVEAPINGKLTVVSLGYVAGYPAARVVFVGVKFPVRGAVEGSEVSEIPARSE